MLRVGLPWWMAAGIPRDREGMRGRGQRSSMSTIAAKSFDCPSVRLGGWAAMQVKLVTC